MYCLLSVSKTALRSFKRFFCYNASNLDVSASELEKVNNVTFSCEEQFQATGLTK